MHAESTVPSGSVDVPGNRTGLPNASVPMRSSSTRSTIGARSTSNGTSPITAYRTSQPSKSAGSAEAEARRAARVCGAIPGDATSMSFGETNANPAPSPARSITPRSSSHAV